MRALLAAMPDHPEMAAWERHLERGDLFVDVGANVGLYSIFAAELGAHVVAVEPQADLIGFLKENLRLNNYEAETHQVALSNQPGHGFLGGGADSSQHALTVAETGLPVRVDTLDAIIGDRVVAGLKIDVEGAERFVLAGGKRALSEGRIRMIQLEWNRASERNFGESRIMLEDLLRAQGYRFSRPSPDGTLYPLACLNYGPDVFASLPNA